MASDGFVISKEIALNVFTLIQRIGKLNYWIIILKWFSQTFTYNLYISASDIGPQHTKENISDVSC